MPTRHALQFTFGKSPKLPATMTTRGGATTVAMAFTRGRAIARRSGSMLTLPVRRLWLSAVTHAASAAPATAAASTQRAITLSPQAAQLLHDAGVSAVMLPNRGRGLVAERSFAVGESIYTEQPLVAVTDATSGDTICAHCFSPLLMPTAIRQPPATAQRQQCSGCTTTYCSSECAQAAWAGGHDALCGGASAPLDAYCRDNGQNFPRVAAACIATSLGQSSSLGFAGFWDAVHRLASGSVPADAAALPPTWHVSYGLVRHALSANMNGNVDAFWGQIFDVRAYARLMMTLRLNAFSVQLPGSSRDGAGATDTFSIGPAAAHPLEGSTAGVSVAGCCGGSGGGGGAAAPSPAVPSVPVGTAAASSTAGTAQACGTAESCAPPPDLFAQAHGGARGAAHDASRASSGTALFETSSLLNHDCGE
jgi:hypothetical protein